MQWAKKQKGFTIVELLIVVVVIAILAAITIVAYNGIQNRAKSAATQSAASQALRKINTFAVTNGDSYPVSAGTDGIDNLSALSINNNGAMNYQYVANNATNPKTFCLTVTNQTISYFVSNAVGTPQLGGCAGHSQNGVTKVTNIALNPHALSTGTAWTNQTPSGSTLTYEPTGAQDGGSAFKIVTTISGQIRIAIPRQAVSVADGDVVTVGVDIFAPVATQVQVELGTSSGTFPKGAVINLTAGWNRVNGSVPITSTSAGTLSLVQISGVSTTLPAGQTWRATKAIITIGPTAYQYADGDSTNWVWTTPASPAASTSTGPPTAL